MPSSTETGGNLFSLVIPLNDLCLEVRKEPFTPQNYRSVEDHLKIGWFFAKKLVSIGRSIEKVDFFGRNLWREVVDFVKDHIFQDLTKISQFHLSRNTQAAVNS